MATKKRTGPKIEILYSKQMVRSSHAMLGGEMFRFYVLDLDSRESTLVATAPIGTERQFTDVGGHRSTQVVLNLSLVSGSSYSHAPVIFTGGSEDTALRHAMLFLSAAYTTVDRVVLPQALVLHAVATGVGPIMRDLSERLPRLVSSTLHTAHQAVLAYASGANEYAVNGSHTALDFTGIAPPVDKETLKQEARNEMVIELEKTTGYTYDELTRMRRQRRPKDPGLEID